MYIYLCMYTSLYMYIYICICICIYYVYIFIHVHIYMYVYINIYINICINIYISKYVYIYIFQTSASSRPRIVQLAQQHARIVVCVVQFCEALDRQPCTAVGKFDKWYIRDRAATARGPFFFGFVCVVHANSRIMNVGGLCVWMGRVLCVNESCHTYEWVMSYLWMSHVTLMNGNPLKYMGM